MIDRQAFANCSALTEINLPKQLGVLKEKAFAGCTNLQKVIISKALEYADSLIFENCLHLEEIIYRGTMQQWKNLEPTKMFDSPSKPIITCKDGNLRYMPESEDWTQI